MRGQGGQDEEGDDEKGKPVLMVNLRDGRREGEGYGH